MKYSKENWFKASVLVLLVLVSGLVFYKTNKTSELSKEDLFLKCAQIYKIKATNLEPINWPNQEKLDLIYSQKTQSCLAYYNSNNNYEKALSEEKDGVRNYLFNVWDYTNDEEVLSYYSRKSADCLENNIKQDKVTLAYKYNKNLEGEGCFLDLSSNHIDLLTNFQKAMMELGFKSRF